MNNIHKSATSRKDELNMFELSFYVALKPNTLDFKYAAVGIIEKGKFKGTTYGYFPDSSIISPLAIYENQVVYTVENGYTELNGNSNKSVIYAITKNKPHIDNALDMWEETFFDINKTKIPELFYPSQLLKELMLKGQYKGVVSSLDWNIVPPSLFTTYWHGANILKTNILEFYPKYVNPKVLS